MLAGMFNGTQTVRQILQRVVIQSLKHKNLYYQGTLENHTCKASGLMCWLGLASDRSSSLHPDTTGTAESPGSLKVPENVQSDIWDNRGKFQPALCCAHLLRCIFGSRHMPRSNSQTFSVPKQILLDPDLEQWSDMARARSCAGLCHTSARCWGAGSGTGSEIRAQSCACLKRGSKGSSNSLSIHFLQGDSAKNMYKCLGCL